MGSSDAGNSLRQLACVEISWFLVRGQGNLVRSLLGTGNGAT